MKYFPEKWVKLYFWIIKKRQKGAELKKTTKKEGWPQTTFIWKNNYNYI